MRAPTLSDLGEELQHEVLLKLAPDERCEAALVCRLWADLVRRSTHKLILDFVDPWWALGTPNSDTLASLFAAVAARRDTLRVLVAEGLDSEQDHQSIGLVGCLVHSMPALESLELGGWSDMESEVALTPPQWLIGLPLLQHLKLTHIAEWSDCMGHLAGLTRLELCNLLDATFRLHPSLTRLRRLREFSLGFDPDPPTDWSHHMAEYGPLGGLHLLQQLPALQAVAVAHASVADLAWVQGLTQVTSLELILLKLRAPRAPPNANLAAAAAGVAAVAAAEWGGSSSGEDAPIVLSSDEEEAVVLTSDDDSSLAGPPTSEDEDGPPPPGADWIPDRLWEGALLPLTRLQHLNLARNNLASLPQCVACMSLLHTLVLFGNPLRSLPGGARCWQSLSHLNLAATTIRDLEGALQGAPQLATLHLPALALDPNRWCAGLRRLLDAFPTLSCIELPFSMCHELTQARRAFPGVQLR